MGENWEVFMIKNIVRISLLFALVGHNVTSHARETPITLSFPCNDVVASEREFKANIQSAAWKWFICLNEKKNGQFTWETFKPSSEVYLSDGGKPLPYVHRSMPAEVISIAKSKAMDINQLFHDIQLTLQVDGLPLEMGGKAVVDREKATFVRYQLLMNEGAFDYIIEKKVYNVNGQEALQDDLDFPSFAWELKTSWLWIGDNREFKTALENDGYQVLPAYYQDEKGDYQVGYAAVSGMHIINKRFSEDWIWVTFENINNHKYTITNSFPAKPMTNQTGPTALAKTQNDIFQKRFPSLSQYELIGIEDGFEPREEKYLANSQIESAFQLRSSCVACHQTAAYSNDKGYFNFALPVDGGIQYPLDKMDESEFNGYKKLDFVWSLKRAQWDRTPVKGEK